MLQEQLSDGIEPSPASIESISAQSIRTFTTAQLAAILKGPHRCNHLNRCAEMLYSRK
jgi:hypothetical protein